VPAAFGAGDLTFGGESLTAVGDRGGLAAGLGCGEWITPVGGGEGDVAGRRGGGMTGGGGGDLADGGGDLMAAGGGGGDLAGGGDCLEGGGNCLGGGEDAVVACVWDSHDVVNRTGDSMG
jgi:hypothetical protein